MNETSKAMRRRMKESAVGSVVWHDVFTGKGIDVGCGPDKLPFEECQPFDLKHGNAERLAVYFSDDTFDYLHSSQCLEHMSDPMLALRHWIKVVKPGGYIVWTVPSWELYEGKRWPSRFNPDHRSSWSLQSHSSPAPIHWNGWTFIKEFPEVETLLLRLIDDNYDYCKGAGVDQTWVESDWVECFIECVMRKL